MMHLFKRTIYILLFLAIHTPLFAQENSIAVPSGTVEIDIFSRYLYNWHLANPTLYYKIRTGIPFSPSDGMTSLQIDYWGYNQNWQITVGWYSFYTPPIFLGPSLDIQGIYEFDHIYLASEEIGGIDYVTILIPNTAMSQYGNISVHSLTGALTLPSTWKDNWQASVGVDKDTQANIQLLKTQNKLSSKGNIGIGTTSPYYDLSVVGNAAFGGTDPCITLNDDVTSSSTPTYIKRFTSTGALEIYNNGTGSNGYITFNTGIGAESMRIEASGNVGIGTTAPGTYKLAVEGKIGARSVKVTTANWADYVFAPTYNLMSLPETEAYIKENQHLPNIPSADEVKANGFHLEEMDAKLLAKIEELTLYIIEQEKRIKTLEEKLKQ